MADLVNDGGSLRFVLVLAAREGLRPPATAGEGVAPGRLLAGGGIEYLDHRDREWWPILRLSALFVSGAGVEQLARDLRALLQGTAQGFSWRPDDEAALALQAGVEGDGAVVEVGVDVSRFLADVAGAPARPGSELALFRFRVAREALVRFAGALEAELTDLAG
jgi:hypothetical protein